MNRPSQLATSDKRRYLRRVLHVGRALVSGPIALFPPPEIDSFGWLEPVLRIEAVPVGFESARSIALFTDGTMNRDKDLLRPVIRHAVWHRVHDKKVAPFWPTIDITLGSCEHALAQVVDTVRGLQELAQRLPFVAFGLSTHRCWPSLPGRALGLLSLYLVNRAQSLTFRAEHRTDDVVASQVLLAFTQLEAKMQPIPRTGWRERYDADLSSERVGALWDWDGSILEPPTTVTSS